MKYRLLAGAGLRRNDLNSKKNKVKVGVVGMGIGSTHLNAYRKLPDSAEIYAVCDLNKERAEHAAKEYGVSQNLYGL